MPLAPGTRLGPVLMMSCFAARLCVTGIAIAEDSSNMIRPRLLATRMYAEVSVALRNGQKWHGDLIGIGEKGVLLLAEPDKETRKSLELGSDKRLKKALSFDDILVLESPASAELVKKYLVLQA